MSSSDRRKKTLDQKDRRKRIRSGDIVILVIVAGLVAVFYNFTVDEIFNILYSPQTGLIVLIIIVQFIWLKSGDRTRVYRIEIQKLRDQRRQDEDFLRKAKEIVEVAIDYPNGEADGRPGDWQRKAKDLQRNLEERL